MECNDARRSLERGARNQMQVPALLVQPVLAKRALALNFAVQAAVGVRNLLAGSEQPEGPATPRNQTQETALL
eukprot:2106613-Rhodomonas_salina.1